MLQSPLTIQSLNVRDGKTLYGFWHRVPDVLLVAPPLYQTCP